MVDENKRLDYIDVVRGLSMICIVLGHLGISRINSFVFTFHVPIFFLITGFFLNRSDSFWFFLKKRFRSLIVPYCISCVAIIVGALLVNQLVNGGDNDKSVLIKWIYASLYGAGDNYNEPFVIYRVGATWFLLATFWGSLVLKLSLRYNCFIRFFIVFLYFIFGITTAKIIWLPLSIQAGGTAILYMYLGYLLKDIIPFVKLLGKEIKVTILAVFLWMWIYFTNSFQGFWLVHCDIGRGITDIMCSLAACACVVILCYYVGRIRINLINKVYEGLAYLGKYSLVMLVFHVVELDVFPWWKMVEKVFGTTSFLLAMYIIVLGKFLWIIAGTMIVSRVNFLRRLFGYHPLKSNIHRS